MRSEKVMKSKKVIDSEKLIFAALNITKVVVIVGIILMVWYGITLAYTLKTAWDMCTEQTTATLQSTTEYVNLHGAYGFKTNTDMAICEYTYEVDNKIYNVNVVQPVDAYYGIHESVDIRYNKDNPSEYYYRLQNSKQWIHSESQ